MTKKILFAIIPLFIVLLLGEIGLRSSGWPKITDAFEHNEPFWIVDPDLKNSPMPHQEEDTTFPVTTNEDGLRTSHSVQKNKKTRIMTLGCSTTFGWGVADDETYPVQLENLFQKDGLDVDVVNGGQPGYTSFQGLWLWNEILENYRPDVVLIGYIVQDARTVSYTDKSQAILQADNRFLKDNFLYRSKIYLALRYVLGKVQIRAKERPSQYEGGIHRVPPEDYVANLRELVKNIRNIGGQAILFGYPLEMGGYTKEHRQILRAAADNLGTGYLDPQEKMEQAAKQDRLYFLRDKGHANAKGNEKIAEWVYSYLKEYKTDW